MIPDYQTLMLAVLRAASQGEVKISDVIPTLADEFMLSEAERAEMLPSGRITLFANRVHWAKTYLKQAGLISQTRRAHYQLSSRGRDALGANLSRIDNSYLSRFPEFLDFRNRSKADDSDVVVKPSEHLSAEKETPDELMRSAHSQVLGELREELLDRLVGSSPAFFERTIIQLLASMGFGGSVEGAGRAIGQSGDGGVDGVIDQDSLGLDRIYVQAKRYASENKVGAPAVRDFFGSLDRFKAAKGVFATTSDFTADAVDTAAMLSKRIVLVNGKRLGELLIRHNVGCRIQETLHIKKIDEDFFDE
ncbi:restriction system protein [Hyphomicrobium sp. 1Nfss2.1]